MFPLLLLLFISFAKSNFAFLGYSNNDYLENIGFLGSNCRNPNN